MTTSLSPFLGSILICPACKSLFQISDGSVLCQSCGVSYPVREGKLFIQDVPPDMVASTNPTAPETWTNWRKANFSYLEEHIKSVAGKNSLLLDVGCGPSQFYSVLGQYPLISCDIYPYPRADVVCDLSQVIPFKPGSFDVIHLSNVLEHIERPPEFVLSLASLLKPGGSIIAMVPFMLGEHQAPYDFHRYTRYGLVSLFRRAGLEMTHFVSYGDALALSTELAGQALGQLNTNFPNCSKFTLKMARVMMSFSLRFACIVNRFVRQMLRIPNTNSPFGTISPHGFMFVARKNA